MAATFIPISTTNLSGGTAASITFSNIPQNYTDLIIKVSGRSTGGGKARAVRMEFNGDTTYTNYSQIWGGTGSNGLNETTKFTSATNLPFYLYGISSSGATASAFGIGEIYIRSYNNSQHKMMQAHFRAESYETWPSGATAIAGFAAGKWSQTAAITSIMIKPDDGLWAQYSSATLYGIKNS